MIFISYLVVHFGELQVQFYEVLFRHKNVVNPVGMVLVEHKVVGSPMPLVVVAA